MGVGGLRGLTEELPGELLPVQQRAVHLVHRPAVGRADSADLGPVGSNGLRQTTAVVTVDRCCAHMSSPMSYTALALTSVGPSEKSSGAVKLSQ